MQIFINGEECVTIADIRNIHRMSQTQSYRIQQDKNFPEKHNLGCSKVVKKKDLLKFFEDKKLKIDNVF